MTAAHVFDHQQLGPFGFIMRDRDRSALTTSALSADFLTQQVA
jgi:hypothetical protein